MIIFIIFLIFYLLWHGAILTFLKYSYRNCPTKETHDLIISSYILCGFCVFVLLIFGVYYANC